MTNINFELPREVWEVTKIVTRTVDLSTLPFPAYNIPYGQTVDLIELGNTASQIASDTSYNSALINNWITTSGYVHTHDDKANVDHTHTGLDILTGGNDSDASSLHTHSNLVTETELETAIQQSISGIDINFDDIYVRKDGPVSQHTGISVTDEQIVNAALKAHDELHTIASHTDTNATGAQLNILTDGSNADCLHYHSWVNIDMEHNSLRSIQGGTPDQYYHLTLEDYTFVTNITATSAEINQALDGIGSFVTASNLTILTDGSNADSLHTHSGTGGTDVHNDLEGLQGGTSYNPSLSPEYYHLDYGQYLALVGGPSSNADDYHTHNFAAAISVLDEGSLICDNVTAINFKGATVQAKDCVNGVVNVYVPPPSYVAHYNADDGDVGGSCEISDPPTTNRKISSPNGGEGDPFYIGDWIGDETHPTVRAGVISIDTPTECSFKNDTDTSVTVTVYGGASTSQILATLVYSNISGDGSVGPTDGITIQISDWATNDDQYKANINVDIDIDAIANLNISGPFSNGGRFYFEIIHDDAEDGTFTYTSPDIFYDVEPHSQTISNVTIAEEIPVLKWLSGILYYYTGSTFAIDVEEMDYLNSNSYRTDYSLYMTTNEYGISSYSVSNASLLGWTSNDNNVNAYYSTTSATINIPSYRFVGTTANIRGGVYDWSSPDTYDDSPTDSICVDTYNRPNTRLAEYFDHEDWRCVISDDNPSDSKFDYPDARNNPAWDESEELTSVDAQYGHNTGGCFRPSYNYTNYDPGFGRDGDHNYSTGFDTTVYLVREFQTDGVTACANGTLTLTMASGSVTSLEMKMGKARDETIYGGTEWLNMLTGYNPATFNFGEEGQGCSTGIVGTAYSWTIGTQNLVYATNGTVYIRVGLRSGARISQMTMVFS